MTDQALRAAQWRHDNAEPPIDERLEAIDDWLGSDACHEWITDTAAELAAGRDVIWGRSGRRNVGLFAQRVRDMLNEEMPGEWCAYCDACLFDQLMGTDDSQQRKELAWSELSAVMAVYATQIASDAAAEYAAHLVDNQTDDSWE